MSICSEKAIIYHQEKINEYYYSLWLITQVASTARAGQFISLYSKDKSRLLPRPLSICEIDREKQLICLIYRINGEGTKEFSHLQANDEIDILGPLGNGFPLQDKPALLIGGGAGIIPLWELAKSLPGEKILVQGYRSLAESIFPKEAWNPFVNESYVCTEDGSLGEKGNVLDVIRNKSLTAQVIYSCGPRPMLKAVKDYAESLSIPAWISLEEHMACGIGACLACVCKTKHKDKHSEVHYQRVCKEGPVFLAEEVDLS
ncbi:dihydroorotate dehydrogenase B (NAD(+)), electron transfer subunit [Clostridia bacterium]|nr:dihydroorotate dehydrogenase B (NAD(+)), electron transfer subunit [Clostridia bacterium]